MFAICGAHGDLSTTPNGPAVDYEYTEIANDENTYYYRPSDRCVFVDYQGLNDRKTTTEGTGRRSDLRADVVRRDGPACVVTQVEEADCDAAHLIPHSKGDEYIKKVMRLRSPKDGLVPRIDMTENGILLSKTVHSKLARGEVALIKTPNYELRPEHIKRFSRGDERETYITLQWIKKPEDFDPEKLEAPRLYQNAGRVIPPSMAFDALQNVDALFGGTGVQLPSTVILDYVYGIAAYKAWRSRPDDGFDQMEAYHNEHYAQIPLPPPSSQDDDTDVTSGPEDPNDLDYDPLDDTDVTPGPEDLNDPNYEPLPSRKRYTPTRRSGLEEAMDELNMFLMHIHGITPEMAAERNQKEIEREEQAAQEASRSKVMEWRNHLDVH